jgi:hypothetical protein
VQAKRLGNKKLGCEKTVTNSGPKNGSFQVDLVRRPKLKVLRMKRGN